MNRFNTLRLKYGDENEIHTVSGSDVSESVSISGSGLSGTTGVARRRPRATSRNQSTSNGEPSSADVVSAMGSGSYTSTPDQSGRSEHDVCGTSSLSNLTTPSWTRTSGQKRSWCRQLRHRQPPEPPAVSMLALHLEVMDMSPRAFTSNHSAI